MHKYDAQQHRTGQIISPLTLQTITIAQMLSVGGEGWVHVCDLLVNAGVEPLMTHPDMSLWQLKQIAKPDTDGLSSLLVRTAELSPLQQQTTSSASNHHSTHHTHSSVLFNWPSFPELLLFMLGPQNQNIL